jgi:hypothetical protein
VWLRARSPHAGPYPPPQVKREAYPARAHLEVLDRAQEATRCWGSPGRIHRLAATSGQQIRNKAAGNPRNASCGSRYQVCWGLEGGVEAASRSVVLPQNMALLSKSEAARPDHEGGRGEDLEPTGMRTWTRTARARVIASTSKIAVGTVVLRETVSGNMCHRDGLEHPARRTAATPAEHYPPAQ